jgi:hypothetical protein
MSAGRRFRANPFLVESAKACFSERSILRACIVSASVLAGLLVLWWPRGPIVSSLPPMPGPRTLVVVSAGLLAVLAWLSARLGADDLAPGSFIPVREYARLTPGAAGSAVRGKLAFGLLHTVFLVALGSPFVLAAAGVSGASPGAALRILAVAGSAAFAFRALGLLLLSLLPGHILARDMIMLGAGAAGMALCTVLFPAGSPLSALLALAGAAPPPAVPSSPGPAVFFWLAPVITSLVAAGVFAAGALASLAAAARTRHARG